MFQQAFGSSFQRLREDAERHPDKYRPELHAVLEGKLDESNARHKLLLQEAVIDFFRAPPEKRESLALEPREEVDLMKESAELDDPETEILQEEIFDSDGLPAFWWLDAKTPAPG